MHLDSSHKRSTSQDAIETLPARLEVRIAIFHEGYIVARTRLVNVQLGRDVLTFTCASLPSHGLPNVNSQLQFGAHASELRASARYVSANYVGWRVYLHDSVVASVLQIVSVLGPGRTYLNDYTNRPVKSARFSSTSKPGKTARALHEYLDRQQLIELSQLHDVSALDDGVSGGGRPRAS